MRHILRTLFRDRDRFELWAGLSFFTISLLLFLSGWTALRGGSAEWVALPAAAFAMLGILGLSGKVPISALILNRGLVAYEPKRGGQIAVIYGAFLFGGGIFGLSSLTYGWLAPSGSYTLAALLSTALLLGGLYIVSSTPILDVPPSPRDKSADKPGEELPPIEPGKPWYMVDDEEMVGGAVELHEEEAEPEPVHYFAVPQVNMNAAAKRPAMLGPDDIVAYAMLEWDWLESPREYSCVRVEQAGLAPLIEDGDLVGINHAVLDHRWLTGKLVAVVHQEEVRLGFLQHNAGQWQLRRNGKPSLDIEPVGIIGAVEWSMKPNAKNIKPPEAVHLQGEPHQAHGAPWRENRGEG
jgi:hypothetical protein